MATYESNNISPYMYTCTDTVIQISTSLQHVHTTSAHQDYKTRNVCFVFDDQTMSSFATVKFLLENFLQFFTMVFKNCLVKEGVPVTLTVE